VFFVTPFYRSLLAPDSTAGSFERAIARVDASSGHPSRDVLVLGDSRVFNGFVATRGDSIAPGLHFVNAAVAGTTPRCWSVFARVVDPQSRRYRAIVVPVDTYADDDGAIGSLDGDGRAFDLRYVGLRANLAESLAIARSFPGLDQQLDAAFSFVLRGPLVRDDLQAFVRDPIARLKALRRPPADDAPATREGSLAGLHVDFARDRIDAPTVSSALRDALAIQILRPVRPSATYAHYRREWLGAIVARYAAASVPVLFVRIPTRPLHRDAPSDPSGSLLDFERAGEARLLSQAPYVALERPELFADADHLNARGADAFSALLARDVARALAAPNATPAVRVPVATDAPVVAAVPAASVAPVTPGAPGTVRSITNVDAKSLARALLVGTPLKFQSFEFALFFGAVVVLFYRLPRGAPRKLLLLAASWYFYARWNAWYLAVLVALSATDYAFGLAIARSAGVRRRVLLVLGVGANLAFLGTAKYADFATQQIANALRLPSDPWLLHVLVPVGISFHTFQSISYLVDVSRGRATAVRSPLDYALYLAFFPQLLAGPIVRAARFFGELWQWQPPATATLARGVGEIGRGLLKKGAIADRFAPVADAYFASVGGHPGALAAWSGAFAFAMQIYFDFSGYSDIAIGCARVLGFDFPENFHRPYLAWSITEFWRRWHMTLSAWLRDYLYIPLGGNRGGRIATLRNLMITMLLGGLWHGASWTFVAWGGYHGALLACERLVGIDRTREAATPVGVRRALGTVVTFALVVVGWVLFRATSFGDAATIVRAMVSGDSGPALLDGGLVAIAAIALGIEVVLEFAPALVARAAPSLRIAAAIATLFALELATSTGEAAPFVYFKF